MIFLILFYSNIIFILKFTNTYLVKLIIFFIILKKSVGAEPSLWEGEGNGKVNPFSGGGDNCLP